MRETAVIGIGNLLQADDGVGIRAVERLAGRELPPGVELLDAGTATLDVLPHLCDKERVLVIDALRGGQEPGTVYRLTPEQLGACAPGSRFAHGVGVADLLLMAQGMGASPEVVIFGVEPAVVELSLELSPVVEASMDRLLASIAEELARP